MLQSFAPVLVFTSQKGVQSDFIGVLPSTIKSLYQCFRNPSKIFTLFHFCFFDRGLGEISISWNLNFIFYSFVISLFYPLYSFLLPLFRLFVPLSFLFLMLLNVNFIVSFLHFYDATLIRILSVNFLILILSFFLFFSFFPPFSQECRLYRIFSEQL